MSRNPETPQLFHTIPAKTDDELRAEWLEKNQIKNCDPEWVRDGSYKKAIDGQTGCKMYRTQSTEIDPTEPPKWKRKPPKSRRRTRK